MSAGWGEILLAFLHDPPDKALSVAAGGRIGSHESRRLYLAKALLGDDEVSRQLMKRVSADVDVMAATVERLPMPKEPHVNVENRQLRIVHPLVGAKESKDFIELRVPELNQSLLDAERDHLLAAVKNLPGHGDGLTFNQFLAAWRLWPDELIAKVDPSFARLPADTRIPDHTIWHHVDITAAFKAATSENQDAALLAFVLGPIQPFIEASRSVRDLWSGSMILSWLSFRATLPIVEQLGPTALVYPALRGNPLLDLWLQDAQRLGDRVLPPGKKHRLAPSLPHRFLAIVPFGADGSAAKGLAAECRDAVARAWQELAGAVKQRVQKTMDPLNSSWDRRWGSQITSYFCASTAVVPIGGSGEEIDTRLARLLANQDSFGTAFPHAEAVRELARSIRESDRPNYEQDHAGRWQYHVELVSRSLASQRAIRHVPIPAVNANADERFPQKCTLFGSFEQMGPDDLRQSKAFWDQAAAQDGLNIDGVRIRPGEALCAVAMVKRFAAPAFLGEQLQLSEKNLRFPDTWTVAAAEWLQKAKIDWQSDWQDENGRYIPWNGQWLHWTKRDQNLEEADACPEGLFALITEARKAQKCGPAPVYYAILKVDGDDLGGWLRGENSPAVREVMHPDLVSYYEALGARAKAGLDANRPVGPALHAAISTALANFALHVVPDVTRKHNGTVIYSGGDDTLVLLPARQALACGLELRQVFGSDYYTKNGREHLVMGSRATLSGGLVIVHAKDDLRLALQDARQAEKQAKEAGKNALVITIRRRSGEHTSALCPWDFAETVNNWRQQFAQGASDRWAYHLAAEQPTLEQLPAEAIRAEMRRHLTRAEEPTLSLIPPDELVAAFDHLCKSLVMNDKAGAITRLSSAKTPLSEFLTLCQSAAFLARGRD